jgi:flagellar biosynthesis/type III secretory pathway protein FliH
MATEPKYDRTLIDVIASSRKDGYKRGYHDGRIAGYDEGFNRGIRKGIKEMEKLYKSSGGE